MCRVAELGRFSGMVGIGCDGEGVCGVYRMNEMTMTDAALVEMCLAGDQGAYADLVRRHQDAVFNLAMSMTRQNYREAEDLTQEAFVRAYRKLGRYNPQYNFRNWVMAIGANLAKNRFRGASRRRRLEEEYVEEHPGRTYHTDPRHKAVKEAIRELPDAYRVAVTLRHIEGMSYEEIAEVLGIGVSAAKMRVKRGVDRLMERLGPHAMGGAS